MAHSLHLVKLTAYYKDVALDGYERFTQIPDEFAMWEFNGVKVSPPLATAIAASRLRSLMTRE